MADCNRNAPSSLPFPETVETVAAELVELVEAIADEANEHLILSDGGNLPRGHVGLTLRSLAEAACVRLRELEGQARAEARRGNL